MPSATGSGEPTAPGSVADVGDLESVANPPAFREQLVAAGAEVPGGGPGDRAFQWRDAAGLHAPYLGSVEGEVPAPWGTDLATALHATVVTAGTAEDWDGADPRVTRRLVQPAEACELDDIAQFTAGSERLTDHDGDGIGEITVGWVFACVSDVSPQELRLAVVEGGDNYIVRGQGFPSPSPAAALPEWTDARIDEVEPPVGRWPGGLQPVTEEWFRQLCH